MQFLAGLAAVGLIAGAAALPQQVDAKSLDLTTTTETKVRDDMPDSAEHRACADPCLLDQDHCLQDHYYCRQRAYTHDCVDLDGDRPGHRHHHKDCQEHCYRWRCFSFNCHRDSSRLDCDLGCSDSDSHCPGFHRYRLRHSHRFWLQHYLRQQLQDHWFHLHYCFRQLNYISCLCYFLHWVSSSRVHCYSGVRCQAGSGYCAYQQPHL